MRYIYIILLSLLVSCKRDNSEEIHIEFNNKTSLAIKKYISNNDKYDSYLLLPSNLLFNDRKEYTGLLIGPMYEDVFDIDRIIGHFLVKNKKVYVMSDCSRFMQYKVKIKYCKTDSVNIKYGDEVIVNRSPLINFIKRSFLLYYKEHELQINTKPDTLFLPKIRRTVIVSDNENRNTK